MSLKRKPPAGNVRRVVAINSNLRGVITNKAGRVVQFESFAERSLLLRLDRDRTVADYNSQPETLTGINERDQSYRYTPDFVVWRRDGRVEIHEVTLNHRRERPNSQRRERLAQTVCQARGWRYIVHTEDTLPCGSELANLLALFRYRPEGYAHEDITEATKRYLRKHQPVLWSELIRELSQETDLAAPKITAALLHLLWHDRLATDLHQPLWCNGNFEVGVSVSWVGGES